MVPRRSDYVPVILTALLALCTSIAASPVDHVEGYSYRPQQAQLARRQDQSATATAQSLVQPRIGIPSNNPRVDPPQANRTMPDRAMNGSAMNPPYPLPARYANNYTMAGTTAPAPLPRPTSTSSTSSTASSTPTPHAKDGPAPMLTSSNTPAVTPQPSPAVSIAIPATSNVSDLEWCGDKRYPPAAYVCYQESAKLCPLKDGVAEQPCGTACFLPSLYSCENNATLVPIGQHWGGAAMADQASVNVQSASPTDYPGAVHADAPAAAAPSAADDYVAGGPSSLTPSEGLGLAATPATAAAAATTPSSPAMSEVAPTPSPTPRVRALEDMKLLANEHDMFTGSPLHDAFVPIPTRDHADAESWMSMMHQRKSFG